MMKSEEHKKEKLEYDRPPFSTQPHPWLVICHEHDRQTQTFFSISEDRSYVRTIPELRNKIIRAYAYEWLVLEDIDSGDCYLWNPISNDKIQLPPLPEYEDCLQCLLSAPPHDPECHILFLLTETTPRDDTDDDENPDDDTDDENPNDGTDDENPNDGTEDGYTDDCTDDGNPDDGTDDGNPDDGIDDGNPDDVTNEENPPDDTDDENPDNDREVNRPTLYFCKPGYNHEFHKQDLESIIGYDKFVAWTVFKGKFYGLTSQSTILLRLELDDDSRTVTVTQMANQSPYDQKPENGPCFRRYLVPSSCDDNDMLLYVHRFFCGKNLEDPNGFLAFRFDFVTKAWVEMESIGEIAIFLGAYWGTTCSTQGTNLESESIYFTKGRYLYIDNLKNPGTLKSLPCPHVSETNPSPFLYWLTLPSQCNRGGQKY